MALKYQEIYQSLASAIRHGHYQPGSQLPNERQLSKQFGCSRMTLRRSLQLLQDDGLLDVQQGSGTYVNDVNSDEVHVSWDRLVILGSQRVDDDCWEIVGKSLRSNLGFSQRLTMNQLRKLLPVGLCTVWQRLAVGEQSDNCWVVVERPMQMQLEN